MSDWEKEFFGDDKHKPVEAVSMEEVLIARYEEMGYTKKFLEKRPKILKRDKGKCRVCDKRVFSLRENRVIVSFQIHHINGDRKDDRDENLITLCAFCHMTVHTGRFDLRLRYFHKRRDEIYDRLSLLREALLYASKLTGKEPYSEIDVWWLFNE